MTSIEFEGLVFDDQARYGFTIARWSGWWDGVPRRVELRDRPQADGAFGSSRNFRSPRTVTVEGSWVGVSMADAYAAMRDIAAMQPLGVPSQFRVIEPFSTLSATVALANGPTLPRQLFSPFFTFAFDVVAYDPLKYGDPVSVSTAPPTSGGGMVWDAPAGSDGVVPEGLFPGVDVFPSELLFPGGS